MDKMEKYQMDFLIDYIELVESGKISMKERFTPIFYGEDQEEIFELKENIEKVVTEKELALLSVFVPTLNHLDVEAAYEYQGMKAKFSIPVKENGIWNLEKSQSILRNNVSKPKGVLLLIENPYTQNDRYIQKTILRLMEIFFFEGEVMELDFYIVSVQKRTKDLNIFSFNETDSFLHLGNYRKEKEIEDEKEELQLTPRSYQIGKRIYEELNYKYEDGKMLSILSGCWGITNALNAVFGAEKDKKILKYKPI